jgi:NAD(P)H-nitrite reductase large subunit
MTASRVVLATGIVSYAWRPQVFDALPRELVSHTAEHEDLRRFAGMRVAVVGAGQSALESAALLSEAGADVTVLVRSPAVEWLDELQSERLLQRLTLYAYRRIGVGGAKSSWLAALPPLFRRLPEARRRSVTIRCVRPAAASWLRPRVGSVDIVGGAAVAHARAAEGVALLELADGSRVEADHVLLATGYRVDVRRSAILDSSLAAAIEVDEGYPVLRPGLESSVPGVHFVGAPAVPAFGPVMRFVCGTWFSSRELTHRVTAGATRRAWCSW